MSNLIGLNWKIKIKLLMYFFFFLQINVQYLNIERLYNNIMPLFYKKNPNKPPPPPHPNNVLQYRLCLETSLMNFPSYYQLYICWFSSSEMQVNSNMKIKMGLYNLMLCHCTIHMLKPLTWLELNIYFDPVAMWPTTIIILFIAGLEWTTSVKSW